MKKTALLAAAAALLCATPAMAGNGYLGARYNTGDVDGSDIDNWNAEGEFGWNGGAGSWGGQFGGQVGSLEPDGGDSASYYTLNGHMFYQGSNWRLGGVITYGTIDDADLDEWTYGVNTSFDFGPDTTFFGSAVLGTISGFGNDYDEWGIDLGVGHYFTDNFRLAGNLGFGSVDDADLDTTTYGINAEWQFSSVPISVTGGWNTINLDTGSGDADASYWGIGARWNFGGGTLRDRNNSTPFNDNGLYASRIYGAAQFN
ncbi:hypothetical protein [Terricaulis sp.]|uniref:hypothetical protein n=1 Tax=Terricaulis sp. TaxID=2768686 RepID=UPI0037849A68